MQWFSKATDRKACCGRQGVTAVTHPLLPLETLPYPEFLLCPQLNSHFHLSLWASLLPLQRLKTTTENPVKPYCACFSPPEGTNLQKTDHCARNCREELPFLTLTPTYAVHNVMGATGCQLRSQASSGTSPCSEGSTSHETPFLGQAYTMTNYRAPKLCQFKTCSIHRAAGITLS